MRRAPRSRPPVPLAECRDCQAPIIFATTKAGKQIPLNVKPSPRGNVAAQLIGRRLHARTLTRDDPAPRGLEQRYMPHAATCTERPGRTGDTPKPTQTALF